MSQFPCGMIPSYPSQNTKLLCNNFAVLYDIDMLNPAFTSIYLHYNKIIMDEGGRKNFMNDPNLDIQASVDSKAFDDPFNHGHLIPSYIVSYDKSDYGPWYDCYYISNISPQYGKFNQVCWAKLENKTRGFIMNKHINLYMITGVAYKSRTHPKIIDGVAIPDFFFKILCTSDCTNGIGFYGSNIDGYNMSCLEKHNIQEIEKIYQGTLVNCPYNQEFWKDF